MRTPYAGAKSKRLKDPVQRVESNSEQLYVNDGVHDQTLLRRLRGHMLAVSRAPQTGMDEATQKARVLVVDDENEVRQVMVRMLTSAGYDVCAARDGAEAISMLDREVVDLVVTDLAMPNGDGMSVLRKVRERNEELPVVLVAGAPTTESAIRAVHYRATEYLTKPLDPDTFIDAVRRALQMTRLAALRRTAMELGHSRSINAASAEERSLTERFERSVAALYMVYQPIVSWSRRCAFGYEALVRSSEPSLPHPGAMFEAAEKLSRTSDLGRQIRAKCGDPLVDADPDITLFVNLHSRDLLDEVLYDPRAPLTAWSTRTVLELTERAAIDGIDDIADRIARLRQLGFRIAVDDIGAGYSGLNSFATVQPDFVKLDITLVRGLDTDPVRRRLVRLLAELCNDLGIFVVAEGVETPAERDALIDLGIDLLQGYLFARPAAPFVRPQF
jgi:EAL domain-containing protein (putative c-di-GMP-specific phosphodiesterase class I)/CheY-like chemotaxis protein